MVGRAARGGAAKRRQSTGKAGGGKRNKAAAAFEDSADFFLADDDAPAKDAEDSEPEEVEETAEEKRLRVAKQYLDRVKAQAADLGSDEEGEEEDDEDGEVHRQSGGLEALQDRISARLQKDFMEGAGHLTRRIAQRLVLPERVAGQGAYGEGKTLRGHRLSVTGVALTADDATGFSVSKDGAVLRWDIETQKRAKMLLPGEGGGSEGKGPDWAIKQQRRQSGAFRSMLAVAVSSDGRYLAAGGGSRAVHIWDVRTSQCIKSFASHKDSISSLAFREGEPTLYSASFDRTIKIWSLSEMAYVDTLFGHQSEILSIDTRRAERCVSSANDHTCRVWKIPEESQLVFRGHSASIDCCCYITSSEWASGAADGSVALWSPTRKKPVFMCRDAHGLPEDGGEEPAIRAAVGSASGWVQSVASAWGTDLVASGAGDGTLKLWQVGDGKHGKMLSPIGGLPARGFVNSIALARSGRFLLAGMGQEPRLGRWARDPGAKNCVLIHQLQLEEES